MTIGPDGGLGQPDRGDLMSARRAEAEARRGQALDAVRGPQGGGGGLETFVVRLECGNVLRQRQNLVADVCGIGYGCDVCDER